MQAAATSLYVHVPFCVVKCGYCDFTSYEVEDRAILDVYLDSLARELELADLPPQPLSVFIGGGTPTFLDEERFRRLLDVLRRFVDLPACREVTIEGNPESVTLAKAQAAREAGVNRFSLGAQSFAASWLRFLDRAHSADDTRAAVAAVRQAGFDNLSLDLMFGLPGQRLEEWERDLGHALELQPDHLSCYNLTFEEGTRLHALRRRGAVQANEPEVDRALFEATRAILADAGFAAYEISNFAGRGGPCVHNDHYWLQGDYVGVGPGAASHRAGVRSTNLKAVAAWAASLRRGLLPLAEAETLSREQRCREALWLGIRRSAGVDVDAVLQRLDTALPPAVERELQQQVAAGLLERRGSRVALTAAGLLLADSVGERLLNA